VIRRKGTFIFLVFFWEILLFSSYSSRAQGEFNKWFFATHIGLDFNSGSPIAITNPIGFLSGTTNACISDSLGNFLFVSGEQVCYNRNFSVMPNGSGLQGSGGGTADTQPVLAVQQLSDDSSYYLFTNTIKGYPLFNTAGLLYSVINMRLDGGLGDIVPGQKSLAMPGAGDACAALTGTRHHNNHYIWILTRNYNNSGVEQFVSYLIDSTGLNLSPVYSPSIVPLSYTNYSYIPVMIRISPDGTKLVCCYFHHGSPIITGVIEFCQFDDAIGIATPLFTISLPNVSGIVNSPISLEFSGNSKLLYVASRLETNPTTSYVYQYDATKSDSVSFKQSEILVGVSPSYQGLQMGPDGKIYGTRAYIDSLNRIQSPSTPGIGCNFQKNAFALLPGTYGWYGFPKFVQRYYVYLHHTGQCQGKEIGFSSTVWPPADSLHWDFGDPASGSLNFSNETNPAHSYSAPGSYTVTLIVRHNDNRMDTGWRMVTILPNPQPALGLDRTICTGDSLIFDAGFCPGCTYLWKDLGTGLTIGTSQTFKTGLAGTYSVNVTNSDGCIGSDTVQLITTAVPSVTNNPLSKTICSGESTNIALISSIPGTNFHWTASLTSGNITGSSSDSGLVINQVLVNHNSSPGMVTYHITPKVGSCIGTPSDYAVTVNPGDSVKVSIAASANNVCAGTSVTFTASPVNGGANPSYQWKVNSVNSGTNSPIFTYTPNNGDLVQCVLTSSNTVCTSNNPATSNTITMIVNPNLPVSVSVTPSANPVCAGTLVTFTATPTYGGTTPSYQWKVNGGNVGTNNPVYTYVLLNGDLVWCILTSSEVCTSSNPASSIQILMVVNNSLPAGVSIAANPNPFCPGTTVNYTATPINGGTSPAYQWKVNGGNAGSNSPDFSYSPQPGDSIWCIMTSNLSCVTSNPATSHKITMVSSPVPVVTFTRCFDSITTINAKPIKLKGGIPLGGTYSGPGVNNGYFYPNLAGAGTKTITYSYTNAALCTASSSLSIINYPFSIFNCGNNLTDIRDGKVYPTLQLGSQCWMAADLDYGVQIPETSHQRDNCVPEKYKSAVGSPQSAVYQWDEMMQYEDIPGLQGLCPPGWHVPAETDWNTLFAIWTNNAFAGAPLKYSGYSGFNALMSGVRHLSVQWDYQDVATFFWSSTPYGAYKAWAHGMNDYDPSVAAYPASRANAFSVRCLKDN